MKAVTEIIDLIKETIINDYNDDFREIDFDCDLSKENQELWIGDSLIEFNFVATKEISLIDYFDVKIQQIHITSMPSKHNIERTNLLTALNNQL